MKVWLLFQRSELALAGEPIGGFGPWMATAGIGAEFSMEFQNMESQGEFSADR